MRQIHPVGFNETFVASGVYTFYEERQPSGVIEHWSIHELPDGSRLVRADMDGRAGDAISLLTEALYRKDSRVERFDVHFYGLYDYDKHAEASYTIFDDKVIIGRMIGADPRRQDEINLPEGCVVRPPAMIDYGLAVPLIASRYGERNTPVFSITLGTNRDDVLKGDIRYHAGGVAFSQEVVVAGRSITAQMFSITSGYETASGPTADGWYLIDRYGIALQHNDDLTGASAVLTQYARRPDPPAS